MPGLDIRSKRIGRGLGLALAAAAGVWLPLAVVLSARAAPAAPAPTFVVNSTTDAVAAGPLADGVCATVFPYSAAPTCTLRAAIMKANHYPGGGVTITFDALVTNGHPLVLSIVRQPVDDETNGDLNLSQSTRLVGNGAGLTVIDARAILDRLFWIEPGARVDMAGLTVENGRAGQYGGGGLYVDVSATLSLDHSAVLSNTDNSGLGGGGLLNGGTLTLTASLVGNNHSSGSGGGVDNDGGRVAIVASTIISNLAGGAGGGLLNFGPRLSLAQSTVMSNTASVNGGGLEAEGSGETDVIASTLTANLAQGDGGGLQAIGGQTNVINSTLSANSAVDYGGGLEASGTSRVALYNASVVANLADLHLAGTGQGGGLSTASGGAMQLHNSLIAGNRASANIGGNWLLWPDDCFGGPTSAGYNLLTYNTCGLSLAAGDLVTPTALLGELQDNGGPTLTHALLPHNPAIDAGDPGGCSGPAAVPLATDQRGQPRVANGAGLTRCDIGAFEAQRTLDLPLLLR